MDRISRRGALGASLMAVAFLATACGSQPSSGGSSSAVPLSTAASTPLARAPVPTDTAAPAPTAPASTPIAAPVVLPSTTATSAVSTTSVPASPVATAASLTPTDSNVDPEDATPSETEGPYFKPSSPERASLLANGVTGTKLVLSGRVLSTGGQPIAKALLDFWQANAQGAYDNAGYTLRGHQFTDAASHYQLTTVIPGLYPGRTRHIHVKVQAPNQPILTTQLYFPDEPHNATDPLFNPKLALAIADTPDGSKAARFDFVLQLS